MKVVHDVGRSIELSLDPEFSLWKYVYSGRPKPYFHPVRTLAGHELSLFEPHDHVWHRGLWFTFKFVNGENFWEEGDVQGTQRLPNPPTVRHDARRTFIEHAAHWARPDGETVAIDERRRIAFVPLDDTAYALDFATTLTPRADTLLDRTPFTTWGGYGGLIFRASRNWQQSRILFDDGSTSDRPTGIPHRWADLSGKLDGGRDRTGGVALFDHPQNVRHPQPWYGKSGEAHYLTAAPLFHEPLPLKAGESLTLRYRVVIHDTTWETDRLNAAYSSWTAEAPL